MVKKIFRAARPSTGLKRATAATTAVILALTGASFSALPAGAASAFACGTNGTPTVTELTDPTFYISTNSSSDSGYLGYAITPSAAFSDLWVGLSGFTGGVVSLASTQPTYQASGNVAAGATVNTYFLATASAATTTAQTHTVTLYSGNPNVAGATPVCVATGTINRVDDTITAKANKVTSVVVSATGTTIGSTATITVQGDTGVIGAGTAYDPAVVALNPASSSTFPAGAWRLTGTQLVMGGVTYDNILKVNNVASKAGAYTATYTYAAINATPTSVQVNPIQYFSSGVKVMKTGTTVASLPALSALTNSLTVATTANVPYVVNAGGQVVYTTTVSNSGSSAVTIDGVSDTLPTSTSTYVSGTAKVGGVGVADPNQQVSGSTTNLVFTGQRTVPANGSLTFTYTVNVTGAAGTVTNAAKAYVGTTQIDTTTDTTDNSPATASVIIAPVPPVVSASTPSTTGITPVSFTPSITSAATIQAESAVIKDPADNGWKTSVTVANQGTYTVNTATGAVTFTAILGFSGTATAITYRATDNYTQTGTGTITVTVAKPAAPAVTAKTGSTVGVTPLNVLPTVTGSGISASAARLLDPADSTYKSTVTIANQGTYVVQSGDGSVTFTAVMGFSGTATAVTYRATDAYAQTGTNTITLTVTKPTGPSVSATTRSTNFNTATTFSPSVTGQGIDGSLARILDPSTSTYKTSFTVAGQGSWSVSAADGSVTFTPNSLYAGTATAVTYRATDAYGQTATNTMTITVGKPTAPSVSAKTGTTSGVTPLQVAPSITGTNIDASLARILDPATSTYKTSFTVAGEGTWEVDLADGSVTFTPVLGFSGTATAITYRASDAYDQTASNTITITVTKPAAPSVSVKTGTTSFNTATTFTPSATGVGIVDNLARLYDPSTATWKTTVVIANQGTWTVDANGIVTFTPLYGFTGTATAITYRVTDAYGQTGTNTMTLTVSKPAAPSVAAKAVTGAYNTETYITMGITGTDIVTGSARLYDPVDRTWKTSVSISGEGSYSINAVTGAVTFSAAPLFAGAATPITYRAADSYSQTGTGVLSVTVSLPDAPTVSAVEATTDFNTALTASPTITGEGIQSGSARLYDPADSTYKTSVTVTGQGTWTVAADGSITFTPTSTFAGPSTQLTYRTTDFFGQTGTGSVQFHVEKPAAPTVWFSAPGTMGGTPVMFAPNIEGVGTSTSSARLYDPADSTWKTSVTVTGQGTYTLDPATGAVTFTPVVGFSGLASGVNFRITDGYGQTGVAAIEVGVEKPAGPTVDASTGNATEFRTPTTATPAATGSSLDLASARVQDPADGQWKTTMTTSQGTYTVNPATGAVTFTPASSFFGTSTPVAYRIADAYGQHGTNSMSFQVGEPRKATASYTDQTVDYQQQANFAVDLTSGDSVANTFCIVTAGGCSTTWGSTAGTWAVSATNGAITFNPAATFAGTTYARIRVSDEFGLYTESLAYATVRTPASNPVVQGATGTDDYGSTIALAPKIDLVAPVASQLLYDHATGTWKTTVVVPGEGTWRVNPDQTVTFIPEDGFAGDATPMQMKVEDVFGASDDAVLNAAIAYPPAPTVDPIDETYQYGKIDYLRPRITGTKIQPAAARLRDPADGQWKTRVTVPDEGEWKVYPGVGNVEFVALRTFTGRTTPIAYRAQDKWGRYDYDKLVKTIGLPDAPVITDATAAFTYGTAKILRPGVDAVRPPFTTARLYDPADGTWKISVTIPGEGTWRAYQGSPAVEFTSLRTFAGDATPITYRVADYFGQTGTGTLTASVTLPAAPEVSDLSASVAYREAGRTSILANVGLTMQYGAARLLDPGDSVWKTAVTIPGEGTWKIYASGKIEFSALRAFAGTTTPLSYRIADVFGQTSTATVTATVALPDAAPSMSSLTTGKARASTEGSVLPVVSGTQMRLGTTCLVDPADGICRTTVTTSQGSWRASTASGKVFFTPARGFTGYTDTLTYHQSDAWGRTATGGVTFLVGFTANVYFGTTSSTLTTTIRTAVASFAGTYAASPSDMPITVLVTPYVPVGATAAQVALADARAEAILDLLASYNIAASKTSPKTATVASDGPRCSIIAHF